MNAAAEGNLDGGEASAQERRRRERGLGAAWQSKVKNGTIALGSFTPLMLASALGPVAVVKALIDAGADVNAKEARGMTPLMYAIATDHGDLEIVKTLIARGADLEAKTLDGETAADWAHKSGATPVPALLKPAGGKATAPAPPALPEPAATTLRPAVERSVALLERASGTFFVNSACGACHAQNVTDFAVAAARPPASASMRPPPRSARTAPRRCSAPPRHACSNDSTAPRVDLVLYTLGALAAAGYPPDRATDAMLFNVLAQQRADGKWHGGGVMRPPMEDGDFTRTALGVRALTVYGPPARAGR